MMKFSLSKRAILFLFLIQLSLHLKGQQPFAGNFMMTFSLSQNDKIKDPPMFWNVDSGKVMVEIQDEMFKKGVSKRILFTPADST